jgi:shikimate kinase
VSRNVACGQRLVYHVFASFRLANLWSAEVEYFRRHKVRRTHDSNEQTGVRDRRVGKRDSREVRVQDGWMPQRGLESSVAIVSAVVVAIPRHSRALDRVTDTRSRFVSR